MKSHLNALYIELVEHVVSFLEPGDVASLRLTSRTMDEKTSRSFTALFKHKSIELTTKTLQQMVQVTSQGRLGCLLQHCTITGIVRNERTAIDEGTASENLRLLAEAFRNLKKRSPKGGLSSLCLRVAARIEGEDGELIEPDDFRSWRAVWDAALHTFNITMAALNESQLPVDRHLDIFGSLKGCSLAFDAFLAINTQMVTSMNVFRSLKKLTVSLSAPHKAATEHESDMESAVTETEAQAQGVHPNHILQDITMLASRIMPELESLELHWYTLRHTTSSSVPSAPCQESTTTICLKECSLRGVYVSESRLLQFLESAHPETLTLTDIRLVSGTYASIFSYLTGADSPVTYYHLDDIREGNSLVYFDVPGKSKFPYFRCRMGPSSLTRQTSDQVKEAIRYGFPVGRVRGSRQRWLWVKSKAREFGPPQAFAYDFIELNAPEKVAA